MSPTEAKEIVVGQKKDCSREEVRKAWETLLNSGDLWQMSSYWRRMGSALYAAGEINHEEAH
jgi:hypothetical protein